MLFTEDNSDSKRKLATIQRISELLPIEGADKIEIAKMHGLGWQVVVEKNKFRIDDLCIFIEVDSVLPEKPEYEFMKERKYRVKTIKLRKTLSQGLILPLTNLPTDELGTPMMPRDGNVSEILGIKKYEIPDNNAGKNLGGFGKAKGKFPSFLRKTDETRIQNYIKVLDELKQYKCYITTKMDGSSISVFVNKGKFGVCSRNLEVKGPNHNYFRLQWLKVKRWFKKLLGIPTPAEPVMDCGHFWKAALKFDIENKLKTLNRNICLQGELVSPWNQGNKHTVTDYELYFYNAWDIDNQKYLDFAELKDICNKLQLNTCPVLMENVDITFNTVEEVLAYAESINYSNGTPAEGIVIRPMKEMPSKVMNGSRLSIKAISNKFLLKYGL
jgi:RNA ligase (TIGR02306 family)